MQLLSYRISRFWALARHTAVSNYVQLLSFTSSLLSSPSLAFKTIPTSHLSFFVFFPSFFFLTEIIFLLPVSVITSHRPAAPLNSPRGISRLQPGTPYLNYKFWATHQSEIPSSKPEHFFLLHKSQFPPISIPRTGPPAPNFRITWPRHSNIYCRIPTAFCPPETFCSIQPCAIAAVNACPTFVSWSFPCFSPHFLFG